jgi:hypothetical protein
VVETQTARKLRGAWYTPPELVDLLSAWAAKAAARAGHVRVLDPACGDGRLLTALGDRLIALGCSVELVGCDVSLEALKAVLDVRIQTVHADALTHDWSADTFDVVIGNPPFLSQMATGTTRGGASRHGGGAYADAAVEFLALSVSLAKPAGGVVALVLPQSVLGARDAAAVRAKVDARAQLAWSWWERRQDHFDASINVCLLGFELRAFASATGITTVPWTSVVTDRLGIPPLDPSALASQGTLADRAEFNANFRDEYYALVPAVSDDADGPPLVPSGLIDPGQCLWGERPVRFAKQVFQHPRVDVSKLTGRFPAWAARKLVPKVLVANQTKVVEAVADPDGAWLPGVPVTTATPRHTLMWGSVDSSIDMVWELSAVLNSPVVSVLAWQAAAGTGLSTTSVRVSPVTLGAMPWPAGSLSAAVVALQAGDVESAAELTCAAYGLGPAAARTIVTWWNEARP